MNIHELFIFVCIPSFSLSFSHFLSRSPLASSSVVYIRIVVMCVHVYTYMYTFFGSVRIHIYVYIFYICIYIYICISIYKCVCLYVCIHMYTYIFAYAYLYIHMRIYLYISIHVIMHKDKAYEWSIHLRMTPLSKYIYLHISQNHLLTYALSLVHSLFPLNFSVCLPFTLCQGFSLEVSAPYHTLFNT